MQLYQLVSTVMDDSISMVAFMYKIYVRDTKNFNTEKLKTLTLPVLHIPQLVRAYVSKTELDLWKHQIRHQHDAQKGWVTGWGDSLENIEEKKKNGRGFMRKMLLQQFSGGGAKIL